MAHERTLRWAPAGLFVLLALVLFAPSVFGGKVLSANDVLLKTPPFPGWQSAQAANPLLQDPAYVFQPDQLQVRRALRSAELPVWTAGISGGRPLLAAQQSAPLYPLNWIGVLFPYWDALVWIAILKLTLAALGTLLLCRALGLGRTPAVLGAVAYAFGTYLIVWLSHPQSNAYGLLPWAFLAAERLCRQRRLVDAAGLAAVLGLVFLGGHPESAAIVSVATAAWVAYRLAALRSTRRQLLRGAALALGAGMLGLALGAVMLLPFAEALTQSVDASRGGPPLAARAALTPFFPEYWGRPDRALPLDESPLLGSAPSNFAEQTLYIGALPAVLAIAGLFGRRPRGAQLFFAALAAAALLIALDSGPITDIARDLPVLSSAQLNRMLVVAAFAGAMLAAFGLEQLIAGPRELRRRMLLAAAVVALLPPLVLVAAHPSSLDAIPDGVRRLAGRDTPLTGEIIGLASVLRWLALAVVGVVLVAAIQLRPGRGQVLGAVGVGLVAADLLVMGFGFQPSIDRSKASPPEPRAVEVMRRLSAGGARVAGDSALGPNTAMHWGLRDARGHELPVVERHRRLWEALGGGFVSPQRTRVAPESAGARGLLDRFAVRAYLAGYQTLPELPIAYEGPDGVVMRNPTALPRAFVAYDWRRSSSLEQSLDLTARGSTRRARDEPVIETTASPPAGRPPAATAARIVEDSDTAVTLAVSARAPGRLVLLDTYYPGWHAEVDGRAVDIDPALAAFRAVRVSAGDHEVRFEYRPASVYVGGAITLLALVALATLVLVGRRRPPEPPPARIDVNRAPPSR